MFLFFDINTFVFILVFAACYCFVCSTILSMQIQPGSLNLHRSRLKCWEKRMISHQSHTCGIDARREALGAAGVVTICIDSPGTLACAPAPLPYLCLSCSLRWSSLSSCKCF